MANDYLHGPEVVIVNSPTGPIKLLKASVIGLVASADDADSVTFPLNVPKLVDTDNVIGSAGTTGTLKNALADINTQGRCLVVVIRVAEGVDAAEAQANIIGDIGADESRTGIEALVNAESETGIRPRLLIAPGFTHLAAVGAALESMAIKLRAIPIIDGEAGNLAAVDAQRSAYAKAYFVYPGVMIGNVMRPASAAVAGHIVRCDDAFGYHQSPSNRKISKITRTSVAVGHVLGSTSSQSNLYSEKNISTIVRQDGGFYLWGNNLADGSLITHERINQIVADTILVAHQRYIDRTIDGDYIKSVIKRVNNFLRKLKKAGIIAAGRVWFDPGLNDDAALASKRAYFDYELALYVPAERLTLRQHSRLATTGEIYNITE